MTRRDETNEQAGMNDDMQLCRDEPARPLARRHDTSRGRRRAAIILGTLVLACSMLGSTSAGAQETAADTTRHWYDTLEVKRPRFARATLGERMALAAFTALALPVGLAVGATTIVPPMINVLTERDRRYVGVTAGSGIGFGGDSTQMTYYPDVRVQLDIGYYFERERPIIVHAALLKDLWITSIHRHDLMAVGAAGGIGVASDAHSYTPFVEGSIGLMNPLGIRFVPLFPMHNYGLRARLGYDMASAGTWYELSLGITSTFGW
jgi:hypothetical protein